MADLDLAFSHSWAAAGPALPGGLPDPEAIPPAGEMPVRLIEGRPGEMGVYRLDLLIAAGAKSTLWLTDAYFVGTNAYIQALAEAARDDVDVRLLVPGVSDLRVTQALSRASYRPLLEAGVRIFEWQGPMLHAKTAVADGHWARVGSTNLNLASWIGNWELDLAVEHPGFAREMEEMFLGDLERATEIVLGPHHEPRASGGPGGRTRGTPGRRAHRRSAARVAAGAFGIGNTVGAAIANRRPLGPAEAGVAAAAGAGLLVLACVALLLPRLLVVPLALLCGWIALTLLGRAWKLYRIRRPE